MSMNDNGQKKPAIPFPHAGVPVVGQPFTFTSIYCPINATLTCNCGGPPGDATTVTIVGSQAAPCPNCRKVYNLGFNPTNGQVQVNIAAPAPEQVPS